MIRRAMVAVIVLGAFAGAPAAASDAPAEVYIQYQAFAPTPIEILPGQTVRWTNESQRTHTVTADGGSFDSGHLLGGERFDTTFTATGTYLYHCQIHPSMTGEVDVRRVILDPLPTQAVPAGDRVDFSGRVADPSRPVRVELSRHGGPYTTIARATAARDGVWHVAVPAAASGTYRASSGSDLSETEPMLVNARRVLLRTTPGGVDVTVTPSDPYAPIVLQLDLQQRFGWWPVHSTHLDYVSQAELSVHGPARLRVVLVAGDGWTPLAMSRVVVLGHAKAPPRGGGMPAMPGMPGMTGMAMTRALTPPGNAGLRAAF